MIAYVAFEGIYQRILEATRKFIAHGKSEHYRRIILLIIVTLALLFRLIYFQTLTETAFLKIPLMYIKSDMYAFLEWAKAILEGDILGIDTYHPYFEWMQAIALQETWYHWWGGKAIFQQAPLYPYWLAGILGLSNGSIELAVLIQLVLGALHPLVMYCLARRLFNDYAGCIAAALTAFYGPLIFEQGALSRDWISPILEPLALLVLLKAQSDRQWRYWSIAGAVLGLAVLAKETILLFFPFAFIWIFVINRRAINRGFAAACLVVLGLLLVLSPLIIRNALVGAPILSISNRMAEGFIEGNAADGFPLGLFYPPSMRAILERSNGQTFAVIRETIKTYTGNPYRFVELQLLKLRGIADPFEIPNNLNFLYGLEISPILRFTLRYGIIAPLAVVGFLCSLKMWRKHLLIGLFGLATLGSLMSTIILGRYRLILVPVLIVYAASGVTTVAELLWRKRLCMAMAVVALIFGVAAIQHWVLPIPLLREMPYFSVHGPLYSLAARIYATEGKFDHAFEELRRLRIQGERYPAFADQLLSISLHEGDYRVAWAMQLLDEGRPETAREQLALAEVAYADHSHLSRPHYNLGLLYLKFSEPSKTQASFERFLEVEPEGPRADRVRQLLAGLQRPSVWSSSERNVE
jgi:4-amino-4-deoxy-L-arabinose transferase-like glycosyltransferase